MLRSIFASSYQQYFGDKAIYLRQVESKAIQRFWRSFALRVWLLSGTGTTATAAMLALARLLQKRGDDQAARSLDAATLFSSVQLLYTMANPLSQLAQNMGGVYAALASFQRLEDAMLGPEDATQEVEATVVQASNERCKQSQMALEARRLGECLQQRLAEANKSGTTQVVHLVGPGASGKTTLITHALRFFLDETNLAVAYAPQRVALFDDLSIRANINLWQRAGLTEDAPDGAEPSSAPALGTASIGDALRFCCLDPDVASLEHGTATCTADLSGGQRQRVALARTVFSRAPILILDDSLSALDAVTAYEIEKNLYGKSGLSRSKILRGRVVLWASTKESQYDAPGSIFRTQLQDGVFELDQTVQLASPDTIDRIQGAASEAETQTEAGATGERISLSSKSGSDEGEEEKHALHLGTAPYIFWFRNTHPGWMATSIAAYLLQFLGQYGSLYVLQGWTSRPLTRDGLLPEPGLWLSLLTLACVGEGMSQGLVWLCLFSQAVPKTGIKYYNKIITALLATSPYNSLLPAQLKARFAQDVAVVDLEFPIQFVNMFRVVEVIISFVTMVIAIPFMAFCVPVVALQFWAVQRGYLVSFLCL